MNVVRGPGDLYPVMLSHDSVNPSSLACSRCQVSFLLSRADVIEILPLNFFFFFNTSIQSDVKWRAAEKSDCTALSHIIISFHLPPHALIFPLYPFYHNHSNAVTTFLSISACLMSHSCS